MATGQKIAFIRKGRWPLANVSTAKALQEQFPEHTVEEIDLIPLIRPFPRHILFDVLDFALGSGWISFLLVLFLLVATGRHLFDRTPRNRFVLLALLQIGVVAGAALLPGETARLWMVLMPLLMAPVGFELATWPPRYRAVAYGCLWLMLVVICQNMTFIYMGPELDGPRH